jgi:hypothetical protein
MNLANRNFQFVPYLIHQTLGYQFIQVDNVDQLIQLSLAVVLVNAVLSMDTVVLELLIVVRIVKVNSEHVAIHQPQFQ